MARNPAFVYEGPGSATIPVGIILFDGTRIATRGTFVRTPITSGSAGDGNALVGITSWCDIPFDIDVADVEWVVPDVDGVGLLRSMQYRVVRAQRHHGTTYWATVELVLADDPQRVSGPRDFKAGRLQRRELGLKMSRIVISSKDAERVARSFNDLVKPNGLNRIRRLAVGKVGSKARKETRAILPAIVGTSAAALTIQGTAPSPGSDNPAYRLRFATRVPVGKMKAKRRKITRRRGIASLALTLPGGKTVRFRSIHRLGSRFRLLRAGPLPERDVAAASSPTQGPHSIATTNCARSGAGPNASCRASSRR